MSLCYPYLFRKGDSLGSKNNVVAFALAFPNAIEKEQIKQEIICSINAGAKEKGPPEDFKAIFEAKIKKKYTYKYLESVSGIDARTIRRIKNEYNRRPKLSHLIALCVAVDLPSSDCTNLLLSAGYVLRKNREEKLYQDFLNNTRSLSVEDCNEILKYAKFDSLTKAEE